MKNMFDSISIKDLECKMIKRRFSLQFCLFLLLIVSAGRAFSAGFQTLLSFDPSSKTCTVPYNEATCKITFSWNTFYNGGGQGGHTSTNKRTFSFNGRVVSTSASGSYTASVSEGNSSYDLRETGASSPLFQGTVTGVPGVAPPLAPVVSNDSRLLLEDISWATVDVKVNDYDQNGDSFSIFDFPNKPSNGSVSINSGKARYIPNSNFCGTDSFTYRVKDSTGLISAEATVSLTVQCVDDAPIAKNDNPSTDEDVIKNIYILSNDIEPDGDSISIYDIPTGPSHGQANISGNYIRYSPYFNYCGADSFTYRIKDVGGKLSNQATVNINVICINDLPIPFSDTSATSEDVPKNISVLANDSDVEGDALSLYDFPRQPSHGSVSINGSFARYTPAANYCGSDSFTYRVRDSQGGVSTLAGTVGVSISCVNDVPLVANDSSTTNEDTARNIAVLSNDTDVDEDSFSIYDFPVSPSHGSVAINGAYARYSPTPDYCGEDSFTYRAKDTTGGVSNQATVTVNVTCVPDAPVINQGSSFTDETLINIPISFTLSAIDKDNSGSQLAWSVVSGSEPSLGSITGIGVGSSRSFIYTPSDSVYGSDVFKMQVSDGSLKDEILVTLEIKRPQIEYEYDALGRLRAMGDSYGQDRSYKYDPAGNRESVVE